MRRPLIALKLAWLLCAVSPLHAAEWTPARLADGQPDVQGSWNAEIYGTYSLTNPRSGGSTKEEQIRKREGKKAKTNPTRIVDPADGEVPYQPWARAKQQDIAANIENPSKQKYVDPQALCVSIGVTRTLFWSELQIQQYPGYVVFLFDKSHTYRVIPLDGRPHIPANIKLWMSDSRGHWEGNTLVVDVTNSNSKHRLSNEGDFASDQVHITERWKFVDADTIEYTSTFTDPSVYTRPWTIASRFLRAHKDDPNWEVWEIECHEGERNFEVLFDDADGTAKPEEHKP